MIIIEIIIIVIIIIFIIIITIFIIIILIDLILLMRRYHNYTKEKTDAFRKNGDIVKTVIVNIKMTLCEHALALAISLCQNVPLPYEN